MYCQEEAEIVNIYLFTLFYQCSLKKQRKAKSIVCKIDAQKYTQRLPLFASSLPF